MDDAFQKGYEDRKAGKTFYDNPWLDVKGKEIEARRWVDGHVQAMIDERAPNDGKEPVAGNIPITKCQKCGKSILIDCPNCDRGTSDDGERQ